MMHEPVRHLAKLCEPSVNIGSYGSHMLAMTHHAILAVVALIAVIRGVHTDPVANLAMRCLAPGSHDNPRKFMSLNLRRNR